MIAPLFSSLQGGAVLQQSILRLIDTARTHAAGGAKVDLQIMCFAFTDSVIASALIDLARAHPAMIIRILADWSQSARGSSSVLDTVTREAPPNLYVKFKLDAPYIWDPDADRLRYSYGASWGMLHHKTLCLRLNAQPVTLALGSYNWSNRGQQAYENLLVLSSPEAGPILDAFDAEFHALWSDHRLTAAPLRARQIFQRLRAEAAKGRNLRDPDLLSDVLGVKGSPLAVARVPPRAMTGGPAIVAFSGSQPPGVTPQGGHADSNDRRQIDLLRPSGVRRPAPLTLNTLALDAMRSVPDGATVKLAIYALSARVPEFATLLNLARRGCRVQVLLDGTIGAGTAENLLAFAQRESLALDVRTTRRRMHQKYLCCPETAMVLTGTANMTEDATTRHSDHRILFRDQADLAAAFAADFDEIWGRLRHQALAA